MKSRHCSYAFVLLLIVQINQLCIAESARQHADIRAQVQQTFSQHCYDCHADGSKAGDLDLKKLSTDLSDPEAMRLWVRIHDRIQSGEMPPQDAKAIIETEKKQVLEKLAAYLSQADRKRSEVVMRRLNRNEYENTVRDLFDIFVLVKNRLPEDTSVSGFDNVGAGLALSPEALQAYLNAADAVLDAVFGPQKQPEYIKHETNLLEQKDWKGRPQLASQYGKMFRKTDKGLVIFQSNYCPTNLVNFARLRPPAGTYRGTIQVRAIQSDQPVTLRIYGGDTIVGRREKHLVGYYDIPPEKWTTIEFTDRLIEAGGTYLPKCYGTIDTRKDADTYPNPGLEIGDITIEGPLEAWPPRSRTALLGDVDLKTATIDDASRMIAKLLPRAFRRNVTPQEIQFYVDLVKSSLEQGDTFEGALRYGLKAILCSPEFLFLEEPGTGTISDYALASRLSYCFWVSLPDAELMTLARQNKLHQPAELQKQVERLLRDPKAQRFVDHFTGQWLRMRDIDFTTPDMKLYPEFDELLKISMVEETHRFFEEILQHDLNLMNFIDSDFVMINERLASHYGISGVRGQKFRRVKLPEESVRGGVLTQASVLKVTANGTNTSPVLRGAWIMENLFGTPSPPPPSNVPAVEPDTRGAVTIRQQLSKHRAIPSCAVCHNKIDPPGFALENFNAIGGWQDRYRTMGAGERPKIKRAPHTYGWVRYKIGLPVDASGITTDGQRFQDVRDFKAIILNNPDLIARGLTRKLLTYAIGREMGFSDRDEINQLVTNVADKNYGFRSLIHEIVQSDLFRRP